MTHPPGGRGPGGFTLVEVMVALVIAALVALAVAGTVSAAADTRARLEARRLELRSRLAWRALVRETLRNARPPAAPGDTAFLLVAGAGFPGPPSDRLVLLTAGVVPPLTPGTDWVVSLEATEDGVRLMAAPVGIRAAPVRIPAPDGAVGMEVEVQAEPDGPWLREWLDPAARPAAVRVVFRTAAGAPTDPLTVRLPALEPIR